MVVTTPNLGDVRLTSVTSEMTSDRNPRNLLSKHHIGAKFGFYSAILGQKALNYESTAEFEFEFWYFDIIL